MGERADERQGRQTGSLGWRGYLWRKGKGVGWQKTSIVQLSPVLPLSVKWGTAPLVPGNHGHLSSIFFLLFTRPCGDLLGKKKKLPTQRFYYTDDPLVGLQW